MADAFCRTRQLETDVTEHAKRFNRRWGPEAFVVDPSAAALRESMFRENLNAVAGNNDVFGGISCVQKHFVMDDGVPRLTIDPGCTSLINELGVYEWMEGRDKPRKENDDNCDALRYGTLYLDSGIGQLEVRVFGGNDSEDGWGDEEWGWQ